MENDLLNPIRTLYGKASDLTKQMATIIYEFKDDSTSQQDLNLLMVEYVKVLSELDRLSNQKELQSLFVPVHLLQIIDEGKHPDYWIKSTLEDLQKENQNSHGKIAQLNDFKDSLVSKLLLNEKDDTLRETLKDLIPSDTLDVDEGIIEIT